MSALLLWAWLFTLPGLILSALAVGKRPGAASQGGPPVMLIVTLFEGLLRSTTVKVSVAPPSVTSVEPPVSVTVTPGVSLSVMLTVMQAMASPL